MKYHQISMRIRDLFLAAWNLEGFLNECRKGDGDPLLRIILASDGTITRTLQALHLCPLTLELKKQGRTRMDSETAKFLETDESESAILRKIWLRKDHHRIFYASSILVFSKPHPLFLRQIKQKLKPLGILLEEFQLPSFKDHWTIGRLAHSGIAGDLGLPPDYELWARHYRMTIQDYVRASVLEVFSPLAFETE